MGSQRRPLDRALTGRLQRALDLAHGAAIDRSHRLVGTEHLLLGVLDEGGNLALQVLRSLDADPADVRTEVEALLDGHEGGRTEAGPVRTPAAKRALELAGHEAIRLGHNYLGCEHLLLGLVSEEEGLGGRALRSMGVEGTVARRAVVSALSGYVHATRTPSPTSAASDDRPLQEILTRLERIEERLAAR